MTTEKKNAPAANEGVQQNELHHDSNPTTEREKCMELVRQHAQRLRTTPPRTPGLRHDGWVQGYQHLARSLLEHDLRLMWMSCCPDCRAHVSELADRLKPKEEAA